MALVVSISNKLIKKFKGNGTAGSEDPTIIEYLDNVGEEWRAFVDDELANSNINNNKTLGGSTKIDDGENSNGDDPNYDDQMEKIMQRFTNFNQILSQGSNDTEENDDSDENEETPDAVIHDSEDTEEEAAKIEAESMKIEKVDYKEPEPLDVEYIDCAFWKAPEPEFDYDSLLAELEAWAISSRTRDIKAVWNYKATYKTINSSQ